MPRCPSCFTPLARVEEDEIKSASCSNCFGAWINTVSLLRRTRLDLERAKKAAALTPEGSPASANELFQCSLSELAEIVQASDTKGMLRCPTCEKPMQKDRFHPMIPVQIDRCRPCKSIWLDAGELTLLRRLYVELMTSADAEVVRRREKVATATAAWEARKTASGETNAGVISGMSEAESAFDLLAYLLRSS